MNAPAPTDPHRLRLLDDVLAIGAPHLLLLAGDDAVLAHGLADPAVARQPRDLEMATEHPAPMAEIEAAVRSGLTERGWRVHTRETNPLSARLIVTDPTTGTPYTVDLLKETLWHPSVPTEPGRALSLEDLVGTKVRALADRGAARDLVAIHAVTDRWGFPDLEELGRRHAWDTLDLAELQARLERAEWIADVEFAAYGLDVQAVAVIRRWAQSWANDIAERLLEEQALQAPSEED